MYCKQTHEWLIIRFGNTEMHACANCDFWWLQPSFPLTDVDDESGESGEDNTAGDDYYQELARSVHLDSQAFYGRALRSW